MIDKYDTECVFLCLTFSYIGIANTYALDCCWDLRVESFEQDCFWGIIICGDESRATEAGEARERFWWRWEGHCCCQGFKGNSKDCSCLVPDSCCSTWRLHYTASGCAFTKFRWFWFLVHLHFIFFCSSFSCWILFSGKLEKWWFDSFDSDVSMWHGQWFVIYIITPSPLLP